MRPLSSAGVFFCFALMVLNIVTAGPIATATIDSPSNTTQALLKRQCSLVPNTGMYACDNMLPTLDQIVARIRDTNDGGLADAEHHAIFYTNLGGGSTELATVQRTSLWVLGWLHNRRMQTGFKFYWWHEHINMRCKSSDLPLLLLCTATHTSLYDTLFWTKGDTPP